jgi:hypothetical protein
MNTETLFHVSHKLTQWIVYCTATGVVWAKCPTEAKAKTIAVALEEWYKTQGIYDCSRG